MSRLLLTISTGLATLVTPAVFAADTEKQAAAAKTLTASPLNAGSIVETFLGLLLVLACIVLVAWLLKRTNSFHSAANGELKVIAGVALGTREKAVLLQVGEQQILVGVTPQQVQTLHVLEQPLSTTDSNSSGFADKLKQVMQQRGQH